MELKKQMLDVLERIRKLHIRWDSPGEQAYLCGMVLWFVLSVIEFMVVPFFPKFFDGTKGLIIFPHVVLELLLVCMLPLFWSASKDEQVEDAPESTEWEAMDKFVAIGLGLVTVTLLIRFIVLVF